jgi:hypothetical protein
MAPQERGSMAPGGLLLEECPRRPAVKDDRGRCAAAAEASGEEPPAQILILTDRKLRIEAADLVECPATKGDICPL